MMRGRHRSRSRRLEYKQRFLASVCLVLAFVLPASALDIYPNNAGYGEYQVSFQYSEPRMQNCKADNLECGAALLMKIYLRCIVLQALYV